MPATSANSRTSSAARSRLPLTPKVMSGRRGGHVSTRPVKSAAETPVIASTPAMHLTPNVVSGARGGLAPTRTTRLSEVFDARALDMRGLRR